VGCRFSDASLRPNTPLPLKAKIVQIDIDRAEIDKNFQTDHHIVGTRAACSNCSKLPEAPPYPA
jgi:acetolactate synthase-1/2/3 large subunit